MLPTNCIISFSFISELLHSQITICFSDFNNYSSAHSIFKSPFNKTWLLLLPQSIVQRGHCITYGRSCLQSSSISPIDISNVQLSGKTPNRIFQLCSASQTARVIGSLIEKCTERLQLPLNLNETDRGMREERWRDTAKENFFLLKIKN
jgi:hypothetical protein